MQEKLERHQLRKDVGNGDVEAKLKARELKRRARQQVRQKQDQSKKGESKEARPQEEPSVKEGRDPFKYRLNENRDGSGSRVVRFKQLPEDMAKPVIRRSSKPLRRPEPNDPRQKALELVQRGNSAASQDLDSTTSARSADSWEHESATAARDGGREALFSRILAGLLDLMAALLAGVLFGFVGASLLSADLTSPAVMEAAIACAVACWILNNSFFLFVARQTPGMMMTELELIADERVQLTLPRVLIRVLLHMLATFSIVGLLWAVFDEQGRCWHDRISRTMIVPLGAAPGEG